MPLHLEFRSQLRQLVRQEAKTTVVLYIFKPSEKFFATNSSHLDSGICNNIFNIPTLCEV